MKIKSAILALGMVIPLWGFSQDNNCLKFKDGTFKVTDPTTKKVCIITRKGEVQTERMEDSDLTYDFTITWLDDCTYTVKPTATTIDRNRDVLKVGMMTVKIIKTTDTSYTQKIEIENNPEFKRFDQVYVVRKKEKKTLD